MDTWILVWKVVLVGGLGLFAAMSVWIAVAGWSDVRNLFSAMQEPRSPAAASRGRRGRAPRRASRTSPPRR